MLCGVKVSPAFRTSLQPLVMAQVGAAWLAMSLVLHATRSLSPEEKRDLALSALRQLWGINMIQGDLDLRHIRFTVEDGIPKAIVLDLGRAEEFKDGDDKVLKEQELFDSLFPACADTNEVF